MVIKVCVSFRQSCFNRYPISNVITPFNSPARSLSEIQVIVKKRHLTNILYICTVPSYISHTVPWRRGGAFASHAGQVRALAKFRQQGPVFHTLVKFNALVKLTTCLLTINFLVNAVVKYVGHK